MDFHPTLISVLVKIIQEGQYQILHVDSENQSITDNFFRTVCLDILFYSSDLCEAQIMGLSYPFAIMNQ